MFNILVLDIGTSSMRGILYDKSGKELSKKQIKYSPIYSHDGSVEQDPNDWKHATVNICKHVVEYCNTNSISLDAIGLTSQRSSIIPVDKEGNHIRDAIMWQDKRTTNICDEFNKYSYEVYKKTGTKIESTFTAVKKIWLKRNEPEVYKEAHKIIVIPDYIINFITGNMITDTTYGARTLLMNLKEKKWDESLLEVFNIDKEKLNHIIDVGSVCGQVTEKFQQLTGIKSGTSVVTAGGDQQCSALGSGVFSAKKMSVTSGTGSYVVTLNHSVVLDEKMRITCQPSIIPNMYNIECMIPTTACIYQWFNDNFYGEKSKNSSDFNEINEDVNKSPIGANGISVFPSFQGDYENPNLKGSIHGISLGTDRADFSRGILEGIAFELSDSIKRIEGLSSSVDEVYVTGGLAKLDTFNQIQADVFNKKMLYSANEESSAFGAWMSTAVTLGVHENYMKAYENKTIQEYAFSPNDKNVKLYKKYKEERNQAVK